MDTQGVRVDRITLTRLTRALRVFAESEVGARAKLQFAILLMLLLMINGLNVFTSYVARDFMTAIAQRNWNAFIQSAYTYILVFAAATFVAGFYRYSEERLGLLYREWLMGRLTQSYMQQRVYYLLNASGLVANPDQRITEDVRSFTTGTVSSLLMILNGGLVVIAFAGVLWSISPWLVAVAVSYAAVGSLVTVALGRPLVRLNYAQADLEANFRSDLVHVQENAESVALLHRERGLQFRLLRGIDNLAANYRRIIAVNRNLIFYTTGYNNYIQLIPVLIVAPLYIRGNTEFGVITQSATAFTQLIGAYSLIVMQFQSLSSLLASLLRLGGLATAIEQTQTTSEGGVQLIEDGDALAYELLTLRSPSSGRSLVTDLSITIPRRTRLLVMGRDETASSALFRATAGMWGPGEGRIMRPPFEKILFLSERPYVPRGTLRESLRPIEYGVGMFDDDQVIQILQALGIASMLDRIGGLDVERDWKNTLSLRELRLLDFARILCCAPVFVLIRLGRTTLSQGEIEQALGLLADNSIGYVNFAGEELVNIVDLSHSYDAMLELSDGGNWKWKQL